MRMNYDSVCRDVKRLRALVEECEASAATCTKYQNELAQYWEGDAANSYKEGLRKLKTKHQKLARDIERAAALIRSVADEMKEEDLRIAAEITRKNAAKAAQISSSTAKSLGSIASKVSSGVSKTVVTVPLPKPDLDDLLTLDDELDGIAATTMTVLNTKTNTSTLSGAANSLISKLFGKG